MLRCRLLGLKGTGSIREPEVELCTVVISQNGKDLLVASCALCRARLSRRSTPSPSCHRLQGRAGHWRPVPATSLSGMPTARLRCGHIRPAG
jgi:hypothetical protein